MSEDDGMETVRPALEGAELPPSPLDRAYEALTEAENICRQLLAKFEAQSETIHHEIQDYSSLVNKPD